MATVDQTEKVMKMSQFEEMNSLVLGDKDGIQTLTSAAAIFVTLCFINVPLAFFYTTMFMCFNLVKKHNPVVYDTFIVTSVSIVAYFVILYLVLQIIYIISDNPVKVITHNGRFPLFYML
jgi:hypothetical protein